MSTSAAAKAPAPSHVAGPAETRKSSGEASPWLAAGFRATKATAGNARAGRVFMGQKYMTNPASMMLLYGPVNYPKVKANFKAERPYKQRDRLAEALLKQPEPDLKAAATALVKLQLLQKRGGTLPQLPHLTNTDQACVLATRADQFADRIARNGYGDLAKVLRDVLGLAKAAQAGAHQASVDILANAHDSTPTDPLDDEESFKSLEALQAAGSQQGEPVRNRMEGLIAGIHSAAFIQDPQDWLKVSWIDPTFKDKLAASGAPTQVQADACRQYATAYLEKICGWLDMAEKLPGEFSVAEQALVDKSTQLRVDLQQLTNPRSAAEIAGDKAGTIAFGPLLRSSPEQRSGAIAMLQKAALLRTQDDWLRFGSNHEIDISAVVPAGTPDRAEAQAYAQYMKAYVKAIKECAEVEMRVMMPGRSPQDLAQLANLAEPVAEVVPHVRTSPPSDLPPSYQDVVAEKQKEKRTERLDAVARQADDLWTRVTSAPSRKAQTRMSEKVRDALHELCKPGTVPSEADFASTRTVVYKLMRSLGSTKEQAVQFAVGLKPQEIGQFVGSLGQKFEAYLEQAPFDSDKYWLANHRPALTEWTKLAQP